MTLLFCWRRQMLEILKLAVWLHKNLSVSFTGQRWHLPRLFWRVALAILTSYYLLMQDLVKEAGEVQHSLESCLILLLMKNGLRTCLSTWRHQPWHYGEPLISKLFLEIQTHLWTVGSQISHIIQSAHCIKKWVGNISVSWCGQCCVCWSVLPPKARFTLKTIVHVVFVE